MKTTCKNISAAMVFGLVLSTAISVQAEPAGLQSAGKLLAQCAVENDAERDAFVGTWRRTNVDEAHAANLSITKTNKPKQLYVRMRAYSGGNQGEISGMAELNNGTAIMHFEDDKAVYGRLTLTMGQTGISVEYMGEHAVLGLGNGVTLEGVYVKGQPHYIAQVEPERVFGTKENVQRAIALVGEKNFLNLRDMFANAIVRENEPFRYSGFIQGAGMETQARADKAGHLYIFGRNVFPGDREMVFYTNDADYAHKLPDWLEFYGDSRDVRIIYKDVK
ncbi:MAG: hypothetical protein Q4F00_05790 [bacterium]|nr:hypothetical protein [bacterium]